MPQFAMQRFLPHDVVQCLEFALSLFASPCSEIRPFRVSLPHPIMELVQDGFINEPRAGEHETEILKFCDLSWSGVELMVRICQFAPDNNMLGFRWVIAQRDGFNKDRERSREKENMPSPSSSMLRSASSDKSIRMSFFSLSSWVDESMNTLREMRQLGDQHHRNEQEAEKRKIRKTGSGSIIQPNMRTETRWTSGNRSEASRCVRSCSPELRRQCSRVECS